MTNPLRVLVLVHEGPRGCTSGIGHAAFRAAAAISPNLTRLTFGVPSDCAGEEIVSPGHRVVYYPRQSGCEDVLRDLGGDHDLVHLHHHYLSEQAICLRDRLRVPLAVTFHCCRRESLIYEEAWCRQYDVPLELLHPLREAAEREQELASRADEVICLSRVEGQFFRRWYPGIRKLHIMPNRHDPALPKFERKSAKNDNVVLFVGRLDPRKGAHLLLDALAHWHGSPLRVLFMGLTVHHDSKPITCLAEAYQAELGKCASRLPAQVRAEFLGWRSREEVLEITANAAAVIIPSLYDACSLTALDTLALQRPIVASRAPGLVEILADQPGVHFFDAGDPDQLIDKLSSVIQNKTNLAPRRIEQTPERVHPYLELYRRMVS